MLRYDFPTLIIVSSSIFAVAVTLIIVIGKARRQKRRWKHLKEIIKK